MVQRVPAPPSTSQHLPALPSTSQHLPALPSTSQHLSAPFSAPPGLPRTARSGSWLPGLDPGLSQECILGCQLCCQDCILGCQDCILGGAASKMRFGTHFGSVFNDKMVPRDLKNH